MKDTIEIRWHGRGGQGAKTAALLLADVAFKTGKYVQGFPEYGPERMGAPITAYNRISSEPIRVHSNIYEPQYVVVVDESLIEPVHVTAGLAEDGAIIINTPKTPDEVRPLLKGYKGRVYTLDAKEISMKTLGKNFPNSPMLAAIVAVSGIMEEEHFLEDMRQSYQHKFAKETRGYRGQHGSIKARLQGGNEVMRTDISKIHDNSKWTELTPGNHVYGGGTSKAFNTGEWRTSTPVLDESKCVHCLLCAPVCPDSCIPVVSGKRLAFDLEHCKGCGICAYQCKFGAITMKEGK